MVSTPLRARRQAIATACRVMAHQGLVDDVLGHISERVDDATLLVRCRGPHERGLRFTTTDDIRLVRPDGSFADGGPADGWAAPAELALHTRVLAARPDVGCVLHAHPRSIVALTLAGLELRPIVGAFNIGATRLVEHGIPTYPRAVLVRRPDLGDELAAALGPAPACLLHGHGLVTTGTSLDQALVRALHLDSLARLTLQLAGLGAAPRPIPAEDLAELPDLGAAFNEELLMRHFTACLDAEWGPTDG